jgi:NAD(P)-dependent dehydrogenase (short-subunit alcohol dehydrogenase family)
MENNLKNQKIVIAGGSSGIGLATAQLLSATQASVIVTGRDLNKLAKVKTENPGIEIFGIDSGDDQELSGFFQQVGKFSHLVITVSGAKGAGPFATLSLEDLRAGFEAKFWPHLKTIQAALPYLEKNGSITIITASSTTSRLPGTSGLAAINGALEMMVPILAKELQPLRINAISPGVIDTDWWNFLNPSDKQTSFEEFSKQIDVGRVGQPAEVASLIYSVVTNGYINGSVIYCHGGLG